MTNGHLMSRDQTVSRDQIVSRIRLTTFAVRTFAGNAIDGQQCGASPAAHEMRITPSALFVDETKCMKIPHSESVKVNFGH